MSTRVTSQSDPTLHAKLVAAWNAEQRPQYVLDGTAHYRVIFNTDGEMEFQYESSESLHDSVSHFPGRS